MKKIVLLSFVMFLFFVANAQKKQNVYLVKNNGKEVKIRDSADFVRIIEEPDSGEVYFNLKEYYKDGTPKLIGKVSSFDPRLIYEGPFVSYYPNGKRKSTVNYKKNASIGTAYYFFADGKVKKSLEYIEEDPIEKKAGIKSLDAKFKLIYQVDSLGKVFVQDGNGRLIEETKIGKDVLIEEGDYKDGYKDGVWTGKYLSGTSSYTETYNLRKLVSGVNTVGDQTYAYTDFGSPPQFKGGINEFYKYLSRSIKYPANAYKSLIGGSVYVSFVVEKDGRVADIKIDKPVYPSIDEEALRVMTASPKWIPGTQRGLPVRVKYNIPIKFNVR
jgi:TonB family protein